MSLNYSFLVDQVDRLVGPEKNMLDYGCGRGELVATALSRKHNAYGCDSYSKLWSRWKTDTVCSDRIICMDADGRIPFPDSTFDVVVANQVFEHIDDFSQPLSEISRVLKPNGTFVNCFPTMEIWWEGHIKAPFAHRFFSSPNRFRRYVMATHRLGIGKHCHEHDSATHAKTWEHLPAVCFYKSEREVKSTMSKYFDIVDRVEPDWIRHRLANHPKFRSLAPPGWLNPLLALACKRLAGCVFVLRKRASYPALTNAMPYITEG